MIEKLLENWLDSASERSYQSVFVQMLAADGYTVLHSTRHGPLEYGKDILAVDPDGVGCAFQLKGHPGGRMTLDEFRKDIQPQLVQLMSQPPSYPGFPPGVHRAFLVSNGQFDEEVQGAVDKMNAFPYPAKVTLWSRGQLFEMCKRHASSLWPSELRENRALLEVYLANPRDQLPTATLAGVLASVLHLNADTPAFASQPERTRTATSAAWLTSIVTTPFVEAENHQAVALAWTLCCVKLVGAAERHSNGDMRRVARSLKLAKDALLDALTALWEEVREHKYFVEGNALADPSVYHWRIGILQGLLATLAIADEELSLLDPDSRESLHKWLLADEHIPELWGEAAVANILPRLIWLRKNDASMRPDARIREMAKAVIGMNQHKSRDALPTPYYDFEDTLRYRMGSPVLSGQLEIGDETFAGSAYTAEALMHLLVRTGLRRECQSLWPDFTKMAHRELRIVSPWHYCTLRAPDGMNQTRMYPPTYRWDQLRREATEEFSPPTIPDELRSCSWLLAMWWQVAPHRLTTEASHVFVEKVLPRWGA